MDELLKPIKSVLPSGLTVITMRAGKPGLIAGEIEIGAGTAHVATVNQEWVGLPHFIEHMLLNGASRKFQSYEGMKILRDKYFAYPNAATNYTWTRYFTPGGSFGQVLPARDFWQAFETAVDGVFFPKFDSPTLERERGRIQEEIKRDMTPLRTDDIKFLAQMLGSKFLEGHILGSPQQVDSYSQDECFDLHARLYTLKNTRVVIVGESINHQTVVQRLETILSNVPVGQQDLPQLERPRIGNGEFRRQLDSANNGQIEIYLNFGAARMADPNFTASMLAFGELARMIDDNVKEKFKLYETGFRPDGDLYGAGLVTLILKTGNREIAQDALSYSLELINSPDTHKSISEKHEELIARAVSNIETDQAPIEAEVRYLMNRNAAGAGLISDSERIRQLKKVTPDEIQTVLKDLNSTPIFLNLRAHPDSLDALPPIETIDAWRAVPIVTSNFPATVNRVNSNG